MPRSIPASSPSLSVSRNCPYRLLKYRIRRVGSGSSVPMKVLQFNVNRSDGEYCTWLPKDGRELPSRRWMRCQPLTISAATCQALPGWYDRRIPVRKYGLLSAERERVSVQLSIETALSKPRCEGSTPASSQRVLARLSASPAQASDTFWSTPGSAA